MADVLIDADLVTPAAAGVTPANALSGHDVTADDFFWYNNGRDVLVVSNADSANAATVTIETPAAPGGLALADRTVSVPANGTRVIGPFDREFYNFGSGDNLNRAKVSFSGNGITTADLTVYLIRL